MDALPAVDGHLDGWIEPLRAVKSSDEIELLRASLRLCDSAQREVRRLLTLAFPKSSCGWPESSSGGPGSSRLPVLADLVAGGRTAEIGGCQAIIICRMGTRHCRHCASAGGYWGDKLAPISSVSLPMRSPDLPPGENGLANAGLKRPAGSARLRLVRCCGRRSVSRATRLPAPFRAHHEERVHDREDTVAP